jgi:hypothetical protein
MPECQDRLCLLREEACNNRFKYLEKTITLQSLSDEKAVSVARKEMDRRLDGMNEFREQLQSQATTFIEKKYYDMEHKLLRSEIDGLREWRSRCEGQTSWANVIAIAAIIISAFVGILHLFKFVI